MAGKRYRFKDLEFWAEHGMINIEDHRYSHSDDRSFELVMVGDWLIRLKALNAEIKRWNKWPDERLEMHNFIDDGVSCAKDAKKQGRPDDPVSMMEAIKSQRRMWALGNGTGTTLHTVGNDESSAASLLPPIPDHPEKIARKAEKAKEKTKRHIIIP